jgi:hypothetical protein
MVAFVLLIGFTVVIGIMVGNWAIQRAGKTGESIVERGEIDTRCADVAIAGVCEGDILRIRNKGAFKIKLKNKNNLVGGSDWIYPNKDSIFIPLPADLNNLNIVPFIEIEGKEHGCSSKAITVTSDYCN